jgi:SAM-dependent methyltransferase
MSNQSLLTKQLKSLSRLGIEINYAFDAGISLFGLNIGRARNPYSGRSSVALRHCLQLAAVDVLDVGSGGGHHAAAFAASGANVTCVDYGTSIYAQESTPTGGVTVVNVDFAQWAPDRQYDLVWASHVLEHQRNPGHFIDRLIACCKPEGRICIIVPTPHRRLWGGHVTLWTPGLLAYNIALAGVDLSDATLEYGYRETWIVFNPRRIVLPFLTYDSGDLDLLAPYLPRGFRENSEPWF